MDENSTQESSAIFHRHENNTDHPDKEPDSVHLDIDSPAKNRYKGEPLSNRKTSIPVLFERASGSWWNPKFDSKILEDQVSISSFPQTRRRFQYACFYIIGSCAAWSIFFAAMSTEYWVPFVIGTIALIFMTVLVLIFSYSKYYHQYCLHTSLFMSILLVILTLSKFILRNGGMSDIGLFTGVIEILLMMYTVLPMPLFMCVIGGGIFSIAYEMCVYLVPPVQTMLDPTPELIGKILIHFCIHLIGIHIFIMYEVRKRSTFWKVGQSIMARQDLVIEKQLKEKMINSLMPETIAKEVVKQREEDNQDAFERLIFRPFTMHQMEHVSILFADIVGFTKMSSNKTAEKLVALLNDLFGRFDKICAKTGCEKICTLGDCYYCVSGCPTPRPDHAKCCVEMGLGMIRAIMEFDEDNDEQVNMRVGIHTGKVLCGVVGIRRFKFDVMSNDVTLANSMESSGQPGRVHISAETYEFLKDEYEVEEGKAEKDYRKAKQLIEKYDSETSKFCVQHEEADRVINTYFITGRKKKDNDSQQCDSSTALNTTMDTEEQTSPDNNANNKEGLVQDGINNQTERRTSLRTQILTNHNDSQSLDSNGVSPALLLGRRQSGFFAISEMSLEEISEAERDATSGDASAMPINETLTKSRQLRQQSDFQLIKCIKQELGNQDYFYKPRINPCTLKFTGSDSSLEKTYREHYLEDSAKVNTFASPRLNAFLDVVVSLIFLVFISVCCFIVFCRSGDPVPWVSIIIFIVSLVIEVGMLIPLVREVGWKRQSPCHEQWRKWIASWYLRHIIGALVISLPVLAVYANFSCSKQQDLAFFYCYLLIVSLLHYCNFTMLSSWMKSIIAFLAGCILVILVNVGVCPSINGMDSINYTTPNKSMESIVSGSTTPIIFNVTVSNKNNLTYELVQDTLFNGEHMSRFEIILDMFLLLLLIWFLNREFEISYRIGFHGDMEAASDRQRMQLEKNQADWLLHNIIPEHISEQLKKTSKYSKNHKDVAVIFASIVNFDEFYDEGFAGGKECLRVLNELISTFEELFDQKEFKDVEKIKTIGHTFMAASGLNEHSRMENRDPKAHLYALMDYAIELQKLVEHFNEGMLEFGFVLSIGYHCGEVTSGVIGTSKLLYDIWGDTVNVASRMYSTGIPGKIQVTEHAANVLGEKFEFEYRGEVAVKGKDNMKTHLLVNKREGATWD